MLGICTLTLQHTLFFLELCRHFLIGFADQVLCDHCFAFFAGDLHDIGHFADCREALEIFWFGIVDPTGCPALVFRSVDHFRIGSAVRNQDNMHVNDTSGRQLFFYVSHYTTISEKNQHFCEERYIFV